MFSVKTTFPNRGRTPTAIKMLLHSGIRFRRVLNEKQKKTTRKYTLGPHTKTQKTVRNHRQIIPSIPQSIPHNKTDQLVDPTSVRVDLTCRFTRLVWPTDPRPVTPDPRPDQYQLYLSTSRPDQWVDPSCWLVWPMGWPNPCRDP